MDYTCTVDGGDSSRGLIRAKFQAQSEIKTVDRKSSLSSESYMQT